MLPRQSKRTSTVVQAPTLEVPYRKQADSLASSLPDSVSHLHRGDLISQDYKLTSQGHVFACTVQLGGQLTASKSASSFASTSESQKRDAMQAAAAVSVESKFVSASASYSKGKSDEIQTNAANVDSSSALAWNARGGNTLLCAK